MEKSSVVKRVSLFVSLVMFMSVLIMPIYTITAKAEINVNHERRAILFLQMMYETKNIEYETAQIMYSTEMFDEDGNVTAQATIVNRDGKLDYAVYNYLTENIDEYGFDCANATELFPQNDKMYYAGALTYFKEDGADLINVSTKQKIKKESGIKQVKKYNKKIKEKKGKTNKQTWIAGYGTNVFDGFLNFGAIDNLRLQNNWENTDWNFVEGIDQGVPVDFDNDGIYGYGLSFCSMYELHQNLYDNHCTPTALTNMMVYYDWQGMNTLKNDSHIDTFNRLRVLVGHQNRNKELNIDGGSSQFNIAYAIEEYMAEMGYNQLGFVIWQTNNFIKYKQAIDRGSLVITNVYIPKENLEDPDQHYGHTVLTLGYEEYRARNTNEYYYYIRVCDGWHTCNMNRYVSLNAYYSSYYNVETILY